MRRLYRGQVHVKHIEDSKGDLVGLEFRCNDCYEQGLRGSYAYWYHNYMTAITSDFSEDYPTYCKGCDLQLTSVEEE